MKAEINFKAYIFIAVLLAAVYSPIETSNKASNQSKNNITFLDDYKIPKDLSEKIKDNDYDLNKETFFEEMNLIMVYLANSKTSNKCYETYQIKEKIKSIEKLHFKDVQGNNIQLCNYEKTNKKIINNYK